MDTVMQLETQQQVRRSDPGGILTFFEKTFGLEGFVDPYGCVHITGKSCDVKDYGYVQDKGKISAGA